MAAVTSSLHPRAALSSPTGSARTLNADNEDEDEHARECNC